MLQILDIFFTVFHSAFVLFILYGWLWKSTRRAHFTALLLTLIAWMLIGLYKGHIGYCPLTDWHWDIKRELGERGMPASFIGYMFEHYFQIHLHRLAYDMIAAAGLVFGVAMSFYKTIKDRRAQAAIRKTQSVA